MKMICSNLDVSNDVLFRQEDKDCHSLWFDPGLDGLFITSTLLHLG